MFTPEQRARLRDDLVSAAEADPRIVAAAVVGSAATGREDAWSDIDLALSLTPGADRDRVVADWTEQIQGHDVVTHLDMPLGDTLFRVFLLRNTLQVDLSFWPEADFGATGPAFRLLFGTAGAREHVPPPSADGMIGMGWLYALHVRSSIARGRVWQAEYMVSGMRDQLLALACLRHGLSAVHGRGIDDVPGELAASFAATLVRSPEPSELARAFAATVEAFLVEVSAVDAGTADRIGPVLREMVAGEPAS